MALEFLKPARIDEVLEVETQVKEIGAAHLVLLQTIRRDDTLLLEAEVTVVLVSLSGKPLRLNPALRAAVAAPGARSTQ
jgi:acyl-CoA thioester hydrolase